MKNNRYQIAFFGIVTSLYWFSLYSYVPTLAPYAESLGATHKMVGLIVGSYGFTQMVLRIPLGVYSDQIKQRKVFVLGGLVLGLLSSFGLWYFSQLLMVLLFRGVAGAAAGAWVAFTVLFSSYFQDTDATKATGILVSFTAVGQMSAMLLGGLFADKYGQTTPFILGSIGALIGLLLSTKIREPRQVAREPIKFAELLSVARKPQLLFVSSLAILVQLLTFGTIFGFTPVAAKNLGATDFQLGLLTTLSTLPVVLSSALSGTFFTDWFGERKTIATGFGIFAVSAGIIPFIDNLSVLIFTQMVGGFGRGLVFPLLMGLSIKTISESKRATAIGFFQAIYGLGMFIGPVLTGTLSDKMGLEFSFWVMGLIGLFGSILTYGFLSPKIVR